MSAAKGMAKVRETLTGRWQVPLLLLGLAILGGGVARIIHGKSPRTFGQEIALVEWLRDAGELRRANLYLTTLLKQVDRPTGERAELHRQMAWVVHEAEQGLARHSATNARAIILNYHAAARLDLALDAEDWRRLGEAYDWTDQDDEAVDAYRQSVTTDPGPSRPDLVRKRIVELRSEFGAALPDDAAVELDCILGDEKTAADVFAWALDHKVESLLERGEAPRAVALVEEAADRLGPSGRRTSACLLGRCLIEEGREEAADQVLRAALNGSEERDELWSRIAWLLGRVQQRDDRPQEAMSFYEEAMRTLPEGEVYDACLFGRAECLAVLARYEHCLEAFGELEERLSQARPHRYVGRDALRASLTSLSESLLQDPNVDEADRRIAPRFLAMALELTGPEEPALRQSYLLRLAGAYTTLARRAQTGVDGIEDAGLAREFLERSGDLNLAAARLLGEGDEGYGDAIWNAAQLFKAAGKTSRMVALLADLVSQNPNSRFRLPALRTLGEAYQANRDWENAITAYGEAIEGYSPLPDALASMTPMAQCLIGQGGAAARRGVELLKDIVDDRTPRSLFTPAAREFRDALVTLSEYYVHVDPQIEPDHQERAIERLEDALAFYPSDGRAPRWRFMLAESYRESAKLLAESGTKLQDPAKQARHEAERRRRLTAALRNYEEVRAAQSAVDETRLGTLERGQLESSCVFAADCWFDLGEYDRALETYEAAAWRYHATPTAVMASMQIAQCHQRMGHEAEARAAIRRLAWLVRTIPAEAFVAAKGMPAKAYWERMIDRMDRMSTQVVLGPGTP